MAANPTNHESIIVKAIEQRQANGRTYALVTSASGKRFSVWDAKLWTQMGEGMVLYADVETQVKDDRTYYTIRALSATPPTIAAPAPSFVPSDLRDTNIRRQVALKCAVEIECAFIGQVPHEELGTPDHITVELLAMADRFVSWLDPSTDNDIPF